MVLSVFWTQRRLKLCLLIERMADSFHFTQFHAIAFKHLVYTIDDTPQKATLTVKLSEALFEMPSTSQRTKAGIKSGVRGVVS